MRIISGKFRGKNLVSPQDDTIRPTSDRVRESLFNILSSRFGPDFSGHRVLDLFAGTGALGIEALSRGADYAVFIDNGITARGVIRQQLENFSLGGHSKLLRRDATELGPVAPFQPFTLVFCDPPYAQGLGEKSLASALTNGWLTGDALVVLEEHKNVEIILPSGFQMIDQRKYGETRIRLLTLHNAEQQN